MFSVCASVTSLTFPCNLERHLIFFLSQCCPQVDKEIHASTSTFFEKRASAGEISAFIFIEWSSGSEILGGSAEDRDYVKAQSFI